MEEDEREKLTRLVAALGDLRDTWMQVSMVLKDHLAEETSNIQERTRLLVEQKLAEIRMPKEK